MNRNIELDGMYQELLLEHSRDPHNFGEMEKPDITAEGFNPLCGDQVCIHVRMGEKAQVKEVRFKGQACSICMASASILTDETAGKSLAQVQSLIQDFRDLMQGKKPPEEFEGDIVCLSGVKNFPVRIKCALLPWTTLNEAIENKKGESA